MSDGIPSTRPIRIAMWSGPRNISTALMRAWENRPDTAVCDEPFYAHYLATTRAPHPGADEVIAHQENDWRRVVDLVTGPVPGQRAIFYQKHMAHHLLPDMDRDWLPLLSHCLLIRDPAETLLSLGKKIETPTLPDTGLPQQVEIYDYLRATGVTPPIVNARDILRDPEKMLKKLCAALGVSFDPAMLSWPPGRRSTDGIWAKYWYENVEKTTGFGPYRPPPGSVPPEWTRLYHECLPLYQRLENFQIPL